MENQITPENFGEHVRAWRERRELSRVDAARFLDVPLRTLEDWEFGKRRPRGLAFRLIVARLAR